MFTKNRCMYIYAIIYIFLLCESPAISVAAPPSIVGTDITDSIITVSGVNFGTKHTPTDYEYFDSYLSDWSCDAIDGSCGAVPAGESIAWTRIIMDGDIVMTNIDGNPLMNINQQNTHYSTGRAWNIWPEYYTGVYGFPNAALVNDFANTNEIFIVYYKMLDESWPTYKPIQDKDCIIYLDNSHRKITGAWVNRGGIGVHYELSSEATGQTMASCPTCLGWKSTSHRENEVFHPGKGKWVEQKVYLKLNTWTKGAPNSDGIVKVWINGTQIIDDSSVILTDTENDRFDVYRIGGNWSTIGGTAWASVYEFGPGEEYFDAKDDVLINYSTIDPSGGVFPAIATVFMSNQSTFGDGPSDLLNGDANFVRQIVGGDSVDQYGFMAWSDTQFKFKTNLNALDTGRSIYLYVTNWSGETNSTGYLIQSSQEAQPPPPSNLLVPFPDN